MDTQVNELPTESALAHEKGQPCGAACSEGSEGPRRVPTAGRSKDDHARTGRAVRTVDGYLLGMRISRSLFDRLGRKQARVACPVARAEIFEAQEYYGQVCGFLPIPPETTP